MPRVQSLDEAAEHNVHHMSKQDSVHLLASGELARFGRKQATGQRSYVSTSFLGVHTLLVQACGESQIIHVKRDRD